MNSVYFHVLKNGSQTFYSPHKIAHFHSNSIKNKFMRFNENQLSGSLINAPQPSNQNSRAIERKSFNKLQLNQLLGFCNFFHLNYRDSLFIPDHTASSSLFKNSCHNGKSSPKTFCWCFANYLLIQCFALLFFAG